MPLVKTFLSKYQFELEYLDGNRRKQTVGVELSGHAVNNEVQLRLFKGKWSHTMIAEPKLFMALMKTAMGLCFDLLRMTGKNGVQAP